MPSAHHTDPECLVPSAKQPCVVQKNTHSPEECPSMPGPNAFLPNRRCDAQFPPNSPYRTTGEMNGACSTTTLAPPCCLPHSNPLSLPLPWPPFNPFDWSPAKKKEAKESSRSSQPIDPRNPVTCLPPKKNKKKYKKEPPAAPAIEPHLLVRPPVPRPFQTGIGTIRSTIQKQNSSVTSVKTSTGVALHCVPVPAPKERAAVKPVPRVPSRTLCAALVESRSFHPSLVPTHVAAAMARPGKPATPVATTIATATAPVATLVGIHAEEAGAFHRQWQRSTTTGDGNGTPSNAATVPSLNDRGNRPHVAPSNRPDELHLRRSSKTTTTPLACTIVVLEGLATVPSVLKGTTATKPMVDPQPFQVGPAMVSSTTDPPCTFTNATCDGTRTSIGMPATGAGRPLWPRKATAFKAGKVPRASVATLPTHDFVFVDSDAGTGPTLNVAPSDRSEEVAAKGLAATAAKDFAGGMPAATQVATIGPGVPTVGMIVDATIMGKEPPDRTAKALPESAGARCPRIFSNGTGNGEQNFTAETKETKEVKETAPMRLTGRLNIGGSSVRGRGVELSCRGHGGEFKLIHGTTCGMVGIPPTDRVVGNPGNEKIGLSTHTINRINGIDHIAEVVFKVGAEKEANRVGPPPKSLQHSSSALKDPAAIESVPTLQSNPVGQTTGISSSMADPRNLPATGAVLQPWQMVPKASLVCDENRCVGVFQGGSLDRIRSTLVKRSSGDPLCATKIASFDQRLEGVGSCLPVAAGHKGGPRRGKTRTGGRRSCTFLVLFLLAATLLIVDVVRAVFAPAEWDLKPGVTSCLSETGDGSCPTFAASHVTPGNPYGVMGDWDVSKVTIMEYMFRDAAAFNADISKWDVSKVTRMKSMFDGAAAFNADISKWEMGQVTDMYRMFLGASAFKQLLCSTSWQNSKGAFGASGSTKSRLLCCNAGSHLNVHVDPLLSGPGHECIEHLDTIKTVICTYNWTLPDDDACVLCPVGQYSESLNVNKSCIPAARDQFVPAPGMNAPSNCSNVTFSNPLADSALCELCPAGKKMIRGITVTNCSKCDAGQFQDLSGKETCQNCPAGYYQDQIGIAYCVGCIPGQYQDQEGTGACKDCPENTAATDRQRAIPCDACGAGRTAPNGSLSCSECLAGQFAEKTNTDEKKCSPCSPGNYTDASNMDACKQCPRGYAQSSPKQTSCIKCSPGEFNGNVGAAACEPCAENTYYGHKGRNSTCIDCPTGWSSSGGSAKCQACGAGTFGDGCKKCPLGFAREGGDIDATQCRQCDLGKTTTVEGAATCSGCDLGTYGSSKGHCSVCPTGQYQDGKGETSCKECDADTYLNEQGKSSKADCVGCSDDKSTGASTGNTKAASCLCRKEDYYQQSTGDCQACPDGADCSLQNGIGLPQLVAVNGFWRPTPNSSIFSDCHQGYSGTEATTLALERCCPPGKCNNNTTPNKNGTMFTHPDEQCLDGYSGTLCLVCANGYVKQGTTCTKCPGGASMANAFIFLGVFTLVLFIVVLGVFLFPQKCVKNAEKGGGYFGQLKIILAFVQILSSMPGVFDTVPWPTGFIEFTFPLNFVNLDFLSVFMAGSCSLSIPFLDQFVLHMILPVASMMAVLVAYQSSRCCLKSNTVKLKHGDELKYQILLLLILFLYPGLATKIFSVFRCNSIVGIEGQLLAADVSVICLETEHVTYLIVAGAFLGLYIIGIPFFMFIVLWRNRKHLHMKEGAEEPTKEHLAVKAKLGGLYLQYEPQYWWFEMAVMIEKMVMTGAMCVVAQGSSVQLLIAILIMQFYMLLVLKTAPYEADSEDWTAFIACVALTLTTIGGFALIMDDPTQRTYESTVLTIVLIGINAVCFTLDILIVIVFDCGTYERFTGGNGNDAKSSKATNNSKVLPITMGDKDRIKAAADRAWE